MKRKVAILAVILLSAFTVLSCLPSENPVSQEQRIDADGFWHGVLHGALFVPVFIISLFHDEVGLYEVNNTGKAYDIGYFIGVIVIATGGAAAGKKRRCD